MLPSFIRHPNSHISRFSCSDHYQCLSVIRFRSILPVAILIIRACISEALQAAIFHFYLKTVLFHRFPDSLGICILQSDKTKSLSPYRLCLRQKGKLRILSCTAQAVSSKLPAAFLIKITLQQFSTCFFPTLFPFKRSSTYAALA